MGIKPTQALKTLELLDDANTVPFIARYRKETTGNLDEVQIQAVADRAEALRALHERKRDVLRLIAEQGSEFVPHDVSPDDRCSELYPARVAGNSIRPLTLISTSTR